MPRRRNFCTYLKYIGFWNTLIFTLRGLWRHTRRRSFTATFTTSASIEYKCTAGEISLLISLTSGTLALGTLFSSPSWVCDVTEGADTLLPLPLRSALARLLRAYKPGAGEISTYLKHISIGDTLLFTLLGLWRNWRRRHLAPFTAALGASASIERGCSGAFCQRVQGDYQWGMTDGARAVQSLDEGDCIVPWGNVVATRLWKKGKWFFSVSRGWSATSPLLGFQQCSECPWESKSHWEKSIERLNQNSKRFQWNYYQSSYSWSALRRFAGSIPARGGLYPASVV
jgi:hypothetical protein